MQTIRTSLTHWFHDPLHRNSFFLFASNATMAGLGFFFWLITARLYKTEYVGLATAAFSISALLAELGTFGLRSGLMHYLPLSTEKNRLINTVMNLSVVICIVIGIVAFLLLGIISPKLAVLRTSIPFLMSFMPFVVLSGVSFIVEAVFMVYRSAEYILIEDIILYGLKLVFPLFLIALTTIGIYLSWFFGLIAAEVICIIILMRKFQYRPMLLIDWSLTRKIARFSIWGMITTVLASLPGIIFPLVVTNLLQERDAAFFYMDLMIVNMLYVISLALSQSLFVEGSYDITKLAANIKKSSRIILLVLIPGILGVSIFGRFVLAILGADYAREGTDLLIVMALSAIPMSVIYIGHAVLSVSHRQPIVALINLITVIILLLLSAAFANKGLIGMGYAWLITYVIAALLYISTTFNTIFAVVKKWLFRIPVNQP